MRIFLSSLKALGILILVIGTIISLAAGITIVAVVGTLVLVLMTIFVLIHEPPPPP